MEGGARVGGESKTGGTTSEGREDAAMKSGGDDLNREMEEKREEEEAAEDEGGEESEVEDDEEEGEDEDVDAALLGFAVEASEVWSLRRWRFPSKVGGLPAYLDPVHVPGGTDMLCDFCEKPLRFLLQVYAPRDDPPSAFHRTLFVFTCTSLSCLRRQHSEQQQQQQPPKVASAEPVSATAAGAVSIVGSGAAAVPAWAGGSGAAAIEATTTEGTAAAETTAAATAAAREDASSSSTPPIWRSAVKAFRCQLPRANSFYDSEPPPAETEGRPLSAHAPMCAWCGTWRGQKRCSKCRAALYCSRDHQVEHWRASHKTECIAAAAASSSSPQSSSGKEPFAAPGFPLWKEHELVVEDEPEEEGEMGEEGREGRGEGKGKQTEVERLLADYRRRVGEEGEYSAEELKGLPKTTAAPGSEQDPCWVNFQARVARAPSQVLRYARDGVGSPLWLTSAPTPTPDSLPRCFSCGGRCGFEFQVLPQLLYFLKPNGGSDMVADDDALDFGTVVVYTCTQSCDITTTTTTTTTTTGGAGGGGQETEQKQQQQQQQQPQTQPYRKELVWVQLPPGGPIG